jgi:N-acetylmuramic acid 6-phosphate etherase
LRLGLACNPGSVMASMVDIMIAPVVGPEILTGSTRLKSGTATKMVLNMLTTGVMIRLGKTYGNLMVDLNASNEKLRDRSERMVSELAGVSRGEAAGVLGRCGGEVKTAILVIRRGLGVEEARGALLAAGGQLRGALESSSGRNK